MELYIVAVWKKSGGKGAGIRQYENNTDELVLLEWAFTREAGLKHAHAALDAYPVQTHQMAYWCVDLSVGDGIDVGDPLINMVVLSRALRLARSQILILINANKDLTALAADPEDAMEINSRLDVVKVWSEKHGDLT